VGAQLYEPLADDADATGSEAGGEPSHVRSPHSLTSGPDPEQPRSHSGVCLTPARVPLSLPPAPAHFGRYEVLGRVAVGGMAEIFFARERSAAGGVRHLGLKLLKRRAQSDEDGAYFEELFQREGRTAMLLAHPNICHVYEFGKVDDRFFIALEWISGRSLRDVITRLTERNETIPAALAAGIAIQVADALHYAHNVRDAHGRALGVVHRDVNPQNIMLRFDGSVQLLDFGVAHVDEPQQDSRAGAVKGKLSYMAPEQLIAGGAIDGRADVFALGVCLYEMLSGARLHKRASVRATLEAILNEPAPRLQQGPAALPRALDDLLQRALEKRPEQRFQTAGALQDALEHCLARNGEVASRRRIADLMQGLFPGESDDLQPTLDASDEVMSHVTVRAALPVLPAPVVSQRPQPQQTRGVPRSLALLVCALAIAAGSWFAVRAARQAEVRPAPAPTTQAAAAPAAPAAPPEQAPAAPAALQADQLHAQQPLEAAPLDPKADGKARSRSRSSRRGKSPAFVVEPGF
jgi:serine/threonine protein kinase